jgi:mono/diheme cytochrome c family protein
MMPGSRGIAAVAALASLQLSIMAAGVSADALDLSKLPPATTAPVEFARDIQPLLADHCVKCHGPEKQKGGLRLDSRAGALKGGDDGAALVPGKSTESKLVHLVAGLDPDTIMPPKGERLTAQQIGLLRAWIDQGADWPDGGKIARSEHWAFQKIRPASVPVIDTNPIDAFITASLAAKGLALSPPTDRATLIRRLSFDLLGLPPTPEEIDVFAADQSPRAYEQLVERLLASPRYGERWGRHWLDVVRYTESQGFEYDHPRDNAWHYRDYVIKSFNDDKPFDRFMKEQIAGDVLEPVTSEGIVGTSLLVCGPWDQAGNSQANVTQKAITREEEMEDMISVVGQTFLGLTVNCARCHSHKFDPIPQEEYYRIKSVFEGVKHGERPIGDPAEVQANEERRAVLKKEIVAAQEVVSRLEAEGRKSAVEQQNSGNADTPRIEHGEAQVRLKKTQEKLAAVQPLPVSYAGFRVQPPPTHLLRRGDVKSPGEVVTPGALSAIADLNADFGLAADAPQAQRLLKFAEWLADPRNPLPARVMANRVWHFHFGQGLVATPSDFGASGARPTHPELLDWLAAKFIESGWSVKSLHRLIVNSATYRQSSEANAAAVKLDADNTLLWRFPPRRLEAEAVRDAMLAVSGQLNLQMGGPSFRPFTTTNFNATFYHLIDKADPEFNRRTVYRMNINSGKEPLLDAFDCPDPSVKTPRRGVTTTPLQALELMNNTFVQRQAGHLAQRALAGANDDLPNAVQAAYRLALSRPATLDEMERALAAAKARSLTSVCWALLNSTEFIYVR